MISYPIMLHSQVNPLANVLFSNMAHDIFAKVTYEATWYMKSVGVQYSN